MKNASKNWPWSVSGIKTRMYQLGNRLGTRKAADEYFLKTLPLEPSHVEFIYPAGIDINKAEQQLRDWVSKRSKHSNQLFFGCLMLPVTVFLSKVLVPAVNVGLVYLLFRINAHFRCIKACGSLKKLMDGDTLSSTLSSSPSTSLPPEVTWTASEDLSNLIIKRSVQVSHSLLSDVSATPPHQNPHHPHPHQRVWHLHPTLNASATSGDVDPNIKGSNIMKDVNDLHDEVVQMLESDLGSVELAKNYQRARMQYFVHNGMQ